jgi:hypothetical protein
MRRILALALALTIPACYADDVDFTGTYKCQGFDPYLNRNYTGTVVIKPYHTVYEMTMTYDTGEVAKGTAGLFSSDTLSVVFQDIKDPKKIGLERYSVAKDNPKNIQGYWVYLGGDKLGSEVCERLK